MISQYYSTNNATTSNTKNVASTNLLITYGNRSVQLKVMKDAMNMYKDSFLEKKKILDEEERKLEELNYQVWSLEDSFCKQVWQFSHEYDFSIIFKHYPFIMETGCTKQKNNHKDDVRRSSELIDLINEIDILEAEIFNLNRGKNVKREVESALTKLQKLQIISDDVTELLRLISPSESSYKLAISMPIYDEIIPNNKNKIKRRKNDSGYQDSKNKKTRDNLKESVKNKSCVKNEKSNSMIKKEVVVIAPKDYPQLSLERSILFSSETTISNVSTQSTSDKKYKNFTLKKRSEISIKFEQHKYNNYYQ